MFVSTMSCAADDAAQVAFELTIRKVRAIGRFVAIRWVFARSLRHGG